MIKILKITMGIAAPSNLGLFISKRNYTHVTKNRKPNKLYPYYYLKPSIWISCE